MANHLVSLYSTTREERGQTQKSVEKKDRITKDFVAQYVSYARKCCTPKIPDETVKELVAAYSSMRDAGASKNTITATPRQLESMIRLSEALAKMELCERVEKRHVEEAHRLILVAMRQSATNPMTGEIDMDLITTGVSTTAKEKVRDICEQMKSIFVSCFLFYSLNTRILFSRRASNTGASLNISTRNSRRSRDLYLTTRTKSASPKSSSETPYVVSRRKTSFLSPATPPSLTSDSLSENYYLPVGFWGFGEIGRAHV